jgi:hypothetical protein
MIGFRGLTALALACAASAMACSSSSGGGGATKFACASNDPTSSTNQTCTSCITSNCNAEAMAAFGSAFASGNASGGQCASYVNCAAACACNDTTCTDNCVAGTSSQCKSAEQTFGTCTLQKCANECVMATVTGDDGGTVVINDDAGTGATGACNIASSGVCLEGVPSSTCASSMGTAVASCPTAGLVGCCNGAIKSCYYAPQTASTAMQVCSATMGTFSTGM